MLSVSSSSRQLRIEPGFAENLGDEQRQGAAAELQRREIDRDAQRRQASALPSLGLAAGLAQHPFADRQDEAVFFGPIEEGARRRECRRRRDPNAASASAPMIAPRRKIDLRLIVQAELIVGRAPRAIRGRVGPRAWRATADRPRRSSRDCHPRASPCTWRGRRSSTALRHRRHRPDRRATPTLAVVAGRGSQLSTIIADDLDDALGEVGGFLAAAHVALQNGEFVAAEPRDHIRLGKRRVRDAPPIALRKRSPPEWPSRSLMNLKRSRSTRCMAKLPEPRRALVMAVRIRSARRCAVRQIGQRDHDGRDSADALRRACAR